jgi:hypothetical protein
MPDVMIRRRIVAGAMRRRKTGRGMTNTKPEIRPSAGTGRRKEEQLIMLLSALSEELALQLAEALERDRLAGGSGLPFDAIMSGLRPRLRQSDRTHRRRVPTPQRAFFEVLEGLIVNDRGEEKKPGRIARQSLDPIWHWLMEVGVAELEPIRDEIGRCILSGQQPALKEALCRFDDVAARTIRDDLKKADASGGALKELTIALGGRRALEDLRELARVLQVGEEIRFLRFGLPPVIDDEVEEQFLMVQEAYEAVMDRAPAAAPYLVLSLAPRLSHPWELFGIAGRLVQAEDDQDLKHSDLAMVGEWLVCDLETEASALKNLKVTDFDPRSADEILRRFAVLQAGMTREVGMRKDGAWGKRLLKARGAISDGLEALFQGVVQELRAGLPMHKATSGARSGALVPFTDKPPEEEAVERLESLMQFLATARLFANQLGYSVAFEKTKNEVTGYLDDFAGGLVNLLAAARRKEREPIRVWADVCQRVMAPIVSEDVLKLVGRRIVAAMADQAKSS